MKLRGGALRGRGGRAVTRLPGGARSPQSDTDEEELPERMVKLVQGFVAVAGLSGVLYAIGFAALHAHYSMLGISEKIAWSSTDIATEGGRFLYQLVFFVADLLVPPRFGTAVTIVLLALVAHLARSAEVHRTAAVRLQKVRPWLLAVAAPLGLLATAALLETTAKVADYSDVLRMRQIPSIFLVDGEKSRIFSHVQLVALFSVAVGYGLSRIWRDVGSLAKVLIVLQWLVAAAAVTLLPIAFGKLMPSVSYPRIIHPLADPNDVLVAVGQSDEKWVVWDCVRRETKLLPEPDEGIALGERIDLLKFGRNQHVGERR
jgi:hypothetical protein